MMITVRVLLISIFLSQVVGEDTCPISSTPADAKGPFYIANVPAETDRLAPEEQLSDPANVLYVEGTVYGSDCIPLKNARVEAWYAGEPDEEGNSYSVDASGNYRGNVLADDCGFYNFTQSFPILYTARPILHVHFRVSPEEDMNQELLVTQMYFEGMIPDSWSGDRNLQVVPIETAADGARSVVFNLHVNTAGTAEIQTCEVLAQTGGSTPPAGDNENGTEDDAPTSTGALTLSRGNILVALSTFFLLLKANEDFF